MASCAAQQRVALPRAAGRGTAPKSAAAARAPAAASVSAARRGAFLSGEADVAALRAAPLRAPRQAAGALCATASNTSIVVAAAAPPPVPAAKPAAPRGADMKALSYSVLAGVVIWLLPAPVGVSLKAWHLLAHFVATIVGIITSVRRPRARLRRRRPGQLA
jgi:hypothetical protein